MTWAIVSLAGLFVGLVTSATMTNHDMGRLLISGMLGVMGAIATSIIGIALGVFGEGDFANFLLAVVGAGVPSIAYRILEGRQPTRLSHP